MVDHNTHLNRRGFLGVAGLSAAGLIVPATASVASAAPPQAHLVLGNDDLSVDWHRAADGWRVHSVRVRDRGEWRSVLAPAGTYGVLSHLESKAPDREAVRRAQAGRYIELLAGTSATAGTGIRFTAEHPSGTLVADWRADGAFQHDLLVTLTWTPNRAGWYSLASPTLATVPEVDLGWAVVPGYWTSSVPATDVELSRRYHLGVPASPFLTEERSTTSLVAAVQSASGDVTLAAAAEPALARDPWPDDQSQLSAWQVAMSPRELGGRLSPTAFSPVLGQQGSWLEAGQPVTVTFRLLVHPGGWTHVTEHITRDVYQLGNFLALARNADSLSHRINRMHDFLVTPASRWHTWTYDELTLGAEGGKLSDVGAMWMMARVTGDPVFVHDRLPYARNFKLAQQSTADGPFHGAALGEYFKDGSWVSEIVWANLEHALGPDYVSPIFTTFYTLADDGNIALFEPSDTEIRERIRLGAERLLRWQHDDGSFDIGYLRDEPATRKYPQLPDLRATWYGFIPAYRVLGDERYLAAARRGADWFIDHAVRTGNFIGVCDDARLIRDFQVVFAAQALLDLAELTGDKRYRKAAVETAEFYTLHVFDHPTADDEAKTFNGDPVADWQLSHVGLPFEHAGFHGSVNGVGPITLASHAGAFVRFHELTGRQLFLDLARAAARGRDEFVGEQSGIPSYYWSYGNGGSSVFPWHGWWHIGWLLDYLIAEAHLRSGGRIGFPHGFCTAKVGSHRPYGFAEGNIHGEPAALWMPRTLVTVDQADVDWLTARSPDGRRLFIIGLNGSPEATTATLRLNRRGVEPGQIATWGATRALSGTARSSAADTWSLELDPHGIVVFTIDLTLSPDPQGPELRSFTINGDETALTVSWAYWGSVSTWAQWRVSGGTDWTDTPHQEGHALTATIDLSAVPAPAMVEVRVASAQPNGVGYSEPLRWPLPWLGPNIALGRPVEVSSVYASQYPGSNLVDGNRTATASRWLSAVGDEQPTATFHLAGITTPKLLRLYTGTLDRQVVVSWLVQSKAADGSWVQVGSVTGNTSLRRDTRLEPVATDQIRLVVTDRSRDPIDVARIFEVEIYDDAEWPS